MPKPSIASCLLVLIFPLAVRAQVAEAPEYLGVLAGGGAPQQPTGVRFYGTDLGWTFSHHGELFMLFGDSWSTKDSLCDVPIHGLPSNDDALAVLPSRYSGGVPSIRLMTQSESPLDFERLRLLREGVSLDMSTNRTPLAGFSDGLRAVGLFQAGAFVRCESGAEASAACPAPFVCEPQVGECQPALLNVPQLCDVEHQTGCYAGQRCTAAGAGFCVDPTSPQPERMNRSPLEVDFVVARESTPADFESKFVWRTNKFYNLAARTIQQLGEHPRDHDYARGTNDLLVWGRPGYFAGDGRHIPLYLLAHELPLVEDAVGKLEFRPRYFAGLDDSGKPRWSDLEAEAAPLSLDGAPAGDARETVVAANQMTISWLGDPIRKWIMLYGGGGAEPSNEIVPGHIAVRYADHPWGPWSAPEVHLSEGGPDQPNTPLGPGGSLYHPDCVKTRTGSCAKSDPVRPAHALTPFCLRPIVEQDVGYFYAPNIIEEYTTANEGGGLDVYWNLSGWNPYRVHFLRTRVFPQSR